MFNYYICLYNNACERNGNKIYLNYNTVASYTPRVPGVKADNVSSVTRVALANHRTGRQKSYIKAESVACEFCRQSVRATYRPS